MLKSAKDNLASIPFFGLLEYQHESQLLFEKTFRLNFVTDFVQNNKTRASLEIPKMSEESIRWVTLLKYFFKF